MPGGSQGAGSASARWVEACRRFVEEHQLGIADDADPDVDTAALTAGE